MKPTRQSRIVERKSPESDGLPNQNRRFFVVVLTLSLLSVTTFWLLERPLHEYYCQHEYIPSMGAVLGFRAGPIPVSGDWEGPLGLVSVDEAGPMYAAGFRVGDIPLEYHGGMMAFCGALQYAESGGDARIVVTTSDEWPAAGLKSRELLVPSPPKIK